MYKPRKKGGRRSARRSHPHHRPSRPRRAPRPVVEPLRPLEGAILVQLHEAGSALPAAELVGGGKPARATALTHLEHLGLVRRSGRKGSQVELVQPERLISGRITCHPKGFAFVTTSDPGRGSDIFVPATLTGDARHGDTVLVQVTAYGDRNPTGRVVAVLQRATNRIAGTYLAGQPTGVVIPADADFPYQVVVRRENAMGAANNAAVMVELLPASNRTSAREGRVVEILGDAALMASQTAMVIRKLGLEETFSDAALAEAAGLDPTVTPGDGRPDLRDVPHITIDGVTARDFDDAVAVTRHDDGTFTLHVSIADVSHYVRPGSALDQEAFRRGTSVYFPDRVLPMLPERLSNDLCSLVPREDRYAFTAILEFSADGEVQASRFLRSVIRSRHRMTYDTVQQILDGDQTARRHFADIVPMLEEMAVLGRLLEKRRLQRGAIGFEIPEGEIVLDEAGHVVDIRRRSRHQAHKIIEEFMLAANEAVARFAAAAGRKLRAPFLYRIHEPPDPAKVTTFKEFTDSLGLEAGTADGSPAWFGRILALVAGTPREYIISNLMLRVMQQARYAPENLGHFGLAATHYTHFTSPIRRYPDLVVHRALASHLGLDQPVPPADGQQLGEHLSQRERLAVEAERETMERAKILYLGDHIGEEFAAVVSGVTGFGLFVELLDHYTSGAVALTDLEDDYYVVDEKQHRLVGRRHGRVFQIGDPVRVRLVSIDRQRRHLNFTVVTGEEEAR